MGTSIEDWSSLVSPRWFVASLCFTGRNTHLILREYSCDGDVNRGLELTCITQMGCRFSLLYW